MSEKLDIAVVGAGAAGICAGRHLAALPDRYRFVVYEQLGDVGGTWRYTENIGTDEHGLPVHSSMYKNLRTNLPKEVMGYPDFPFGDGGKSFIHHSEVLKYLEDYARHFNVYDFIEFHTQVKEIRPKKLATKITWGVSVRNVISGQEEHREFDGVMVCNGHYSVPDVPKLPGLDDYRGTVMHSHHYRCSAAFKGLKVVVLGAGPSGIDISMELSQVSKEVILSHNREKTFSNLPENMTEEVGIASLFEKGVVFLNGRSYAADAVILCTGYKYDYPFLHESCHVTVEDGRVSPLYKHLFHTEFPSLAIWAVPSKILPFPIFHQQVLLYLKYMDGGMKLPGKPEMDLDTERDFHHRQKLGMPVRHAHVMIGVLQWDYDDEISELGGFPPLSPSVRGLFNHIHFIRKKNTLKYKDVDFKIVDDENFLQLNELEV